MIRRPSSLKTGSVEHTEGAYRREDLLEVRSMEEVIAVEAARVREEMNARTPLVDLRTSATGEKPAEQARLPTPRHLRVCGCMKNTSFREEPFYEVGE